MSPPLWPSDTITALVHSPGSQPSLTLQTFPTTPTVLGLASASPSLPPLALPHIIRIHAVALTRGELSWQEPLAARPFAVPGYDVAGVVVEAPPLPTSRGADDDDEEAEKGTTIFPAGTRVLARLDFARPGGLRTFAAVAAADLAEMPKFARGGGGVRGEDEGPATPMPFSFAEAATVPISALTAWQALFVHGGLAEPPADVVVPAGSMTSSESPPPSPSANAANASKRLLVTAGAGGVGLWAVQLARLAGVGEVVATAGEANAAFVRDQLGAHRVVDYAAHPDLGAWMAGAEADRRFDVVLDCVGGATLAGAWRCVRIDGKGIVVSVAQPAETMRPKEGESGGAGLGLVRAPWFVVESNRRQLSAVATLLGQGQVRAFVDSVWRLLPTPEEEGKGRENEGFRGAFDRLEQGHARGKVVLMVVADKEYE